MQQGDPQERFSGEDNQKCISTTQVVHENMEQAVPFLPTWHSLCADARIVNRRQMPNDGLYHHSQLVFRVVSNLLQNRCRAVSGVYN
jgi:hypothetical protein